MTSRSVQETDAEPPLEEVRYCVRFDWGYLDNVRVRPSGKGFVVPKGLGPGVYRLRGSRRRGKPEDDVWYVGQSIASARARIVSHVREDFDPNTAKGKRFRELLGAADGWVEIEMARNISLNGDSRLIGIENGTFLGKKRLKELSKEDRRRVQFLLNLIESAGQVAATSYFGAQGCR